MNNEAVTNFKQIFVCHIPKTAGTSLWLSAQKHFKKEDLLYGIHYSELITIPLDRLRQFKYVHGHFPLNASMGLGDGCFRLFFVREPAARILSLYNFWRRAFLTNPKQWAPNSGPYQAGTHDLLQFLAIPELQLEFHNAQARYACASSISLDVGSIGRESLTRAIEWANVCGISEHFDRSVMMINDRLGLDLLDPCLTSNVTRDIPVGEDLRTIADLSRAELQAIEARTDLDLLLYELAHEHFLRSGYL